MSNSLITKTLKQIVADHGPEVLKNKRQVLSLFADYCPGATVEKSKLQKAYDAGVIQEMIKNANAQDATSVVNRAIQGLKDNAFMDDAIASALVYEIAEVLNLPCSPHPVTSSTAQPAAPKNQRATQSQSRAEEQPAWQPAKSSVQAKPKIKKKPLIVSLVLVAAVLIAIVMVITVIIPWFQDIKTAANWELELGYEKTSYRIIAYKGSKEDVIIPTTYKGKPIITIGPGVSFAGEESFEKIKSITIPDDAKIAISMYAFEGCTSLQSVNMGNAGGRIGDHAFEGCTGLLEVKFGNNVEWIGNYAFNGCTQLDNITFPASVKHIGERAFKDCAMLRTVTFEDSPAVIGPYAFHNCTFLTTLEFGEFVTEIGERAFYECTALDRLIIPKSVSVIGCGAFERCEDLDSVNFKATTGWTWTFPNSSESGTFDPLELEIPSRAASYLTYSGYYYQADWKREE